MKDLDSIKKGFSESFEYLTKRCSEPVSEQNDFLVREFLVDGVSMAIGIHSDSDRIRLYSINHSFEASHPLRYIKFFEISATKQASCDEVIFMREISSSVITVKEEKFNRLLIEGRAINDLLGNIEIILSPE